MSAGHRQSLFQLPIGLTPTDDSAQAQNAGKVVERRASKISGAANPGPIQRESSTKLSLVEPVLSEVQDQVLCYYEYDAGRRIRRKLNFGTPRTTEAAAQLGVTFADCVIK